MSSGGPDHPRSRGVYKGEFYPCKPDVGSSPLARGLPAVGGLDDPIVRIIPARAGFTGRQPVRRRPGWDHPRSRGVYVDGVGAQALEPGSSLLARGLRRLVHQLRLVGRIIPARAGFTFGWLGVPAQPWDHPRSRGVYSPGTSGPSKSLGSSPLARGLPREPTSSAARRRDHPRSRGVYTTSVSRVLICGGSSPLARGLPTLKRLEIDRARIIPARAGFTPSGQAGVSSVPGSSPLARGLRTVTNAAVIVRGIIPARAGFTRVGLNGRVQESDHPRSRGVYLPAVIA